MVIKSPLSFVLASPAGDIFESHNQIGADESKQPEDKYAYKKLSARKTRLAFNVH